MEFQEAFAKFKQYKDTKAPVNDGVFLYSRGTIKSLEFDLELVDGNVTLVARVQREQTEASEPAKPAKRK